MEGIKGCKLVAVNEYPGRKNTLGNRANYVIIENRHAHIFFSRWGALDIPSVMLSGAEATLAYMRQLTPIDSLLNNVWAEGGILLDVDTHHALFWGGDSIALHPYLRRPLLAVLPLLWPGWSINWALFGVADLARGIGWEVSQILEDEFDDAAFLTGSGAVITETQLLDSLKVDGSGTILTIRKKTGEVGDYLFSVDEHFYEPGEHRFSAMPYQILSLGSQLLTTLHTQPTISLPKEGSEQEPLRGAYIDEETQTIWVWENNTLDPRYLEALARRWPGWQAHGHVDGLVRHVILSGRDSTTLRVSEQQAIQELISELTHNQGIDPVRTSQAIQQALPQEKPEEMKFGIGFFSTDSPPLTPQERRDILNRLFSGLLENDKIRE